MQYKFRGKRIDNNEWMYGSLISWPGGDAEIASFRTETEGDKFMVDPATVGMWTGLKDKNGKEIYEGDILKSFSPTVPSYEVFYSRSSYRLRYKLKNGDWYDWGPLFRMEEIQWEGRLPLCPDVIGNIHDNPELLTPSQKGDVNYNMNNNFDPNAPKPNEEGQPADALPGTSDEPVNTDGEKAPETPADSEEGGTQG